MELTLTYLVETYLCFLWSTLEKLLPFYPCLSPPDLWIKSNIRVNVESLKHWIYVTDKFSHSFHLLKTFGILIGTKLSLSLSDILEGYRKIYLCLKSGTVRRWINKISIPSLTWTSTRTVYRRQTENSGWGGKGTGTGPPSGGTCCKSQRERGPKTNLFG